MSLTMGQGSMVTVTFYKMASNICSSRQVGSVSCDIELSDKWKNIFNVQLAKVLLKEKVGS